MKPQSSFTKMLKTAFIILLAVLCSLLVAAVILLTAGYSPIDAYVAIIKGAFGSKTAITQMLCKTTPLLLTGLAISVAFKGSSFNIGGEGQFYAGAVGCVICEMFLRKVCNVGWIIIPLCLLGAILFGALWGSIPGYLKVKRGSSEVVTSVMLSSIMILLVKYLISQGGPLAEPRDVYPESEEIIDAAKLPYILPGTRLHLGFVIALAMAVLLYLFLTKTTFGYKIKTTGLNAAAAEYSGIPIGIVTISTMSMSGAIAGLAGGIEVLGTAWKLYAGLSPGYGYNAIAVALLGRLHPIGIVFSALLFGILNTGSNQMARSIGIPSSIAAILQALVLLFVVGYSVLEDKQLLRRKEVAK